MNDRYLLFLDRYTKYLPRQLENCEVGYYFVNMPFQPVGIPSRTKPDLPHLGTWQFPEPSQAP